MKKKIIKLRSRLAKLEELQCAKVCDKYLLNVGKYLKKEKYNESFLEAIESQIDITTESSDDFRRAIMAFYGAVIFRNGEVSWDINPQLRQAVQKYVQLKTRAPIVDAPEISADSCESATIAETTTEVTTN